LSEKKDPYGLRKIKLDWKLTELDRTSFTTAQKFLAQEFGRQGIGRVQIREYKKDWPEIELNAVMAGWHHVGTTRMHADPKRGVINADCRLHSADNLFLAGSSVFPSNEGQPTLMIVALALKLADKLKSQLKEA
jgi:choline dehydrogenase-like flavoprotein